MGCHQKGCPLESHHQSVQVVHSKETSYIVPPRRCISESKIRVFLKVLAQEETSKKSQKKKIQNFFSHKFHFYQTNKIKAKKYVRSTNSFLFNIFSFLYLSCNFNYLSFNFNYVYFFNLSHIYNLTSKKSVCK